MVSGEVSERNRNERGSVIGIGTDIVECQRIARMMESHGDAFIKRVYSPREIDYCAGRKMSYQHYAGRWAAKEAVLKALGTGWARGIQWTDVEMVGGPSGKPEVTLHNLAASIAQQAGITEILISISHTREYAVAFATALGN